MDTVQTARSYKSLGFNPFPLSPHSKVPVAGVSFANIGNVKFRKDSNIGLFSGSKNGLVVIDADNEESRQFVLAYLKQAGVYDWTTVVWTPKRGGLHFWVKIHGVPESAQAYYKLPKEVGGGELRVKYPAYVVAPPSHLPEGEYTFVQGSPEFFAEQPSFPWLWLSWLVAKEKLLNAMMSRIDDSEVVQPKRKMMRRDSPGILRLLDDMETGDSVRKRNFYTGKEMSDTFSSYSEAEFALVLGLVLSGWDFDEIKQTFDDRLPKHYNSVPNKNRYLLHTYNKVVSQVNR